MALVFPNQRAGLFFSKHLAKHIRKPILMPPLLTINDIMIKASGLTKEDPIHSVFKLFRIYQKHMGVERNLENFYFWGEVLLSDFDQADRFLVNTRQLFANVKELKEIEKRFDELTPEQAQALRDYLGVMDSQKPSDLKANYLSIWSMLGQIYNDFREELTSKGLCYEGLAYRLVAERLGNNEPIDQLPPSIAFIGFNALSPSEAKLFDYFRHKGQGLFYWDYHPTFIKDPNNQAGHFLRTNVERYGNNLTPVPIDDSEPYPEIVTVIAAPSQVAQAKLIPRLLSNVQAEGGALDHTSAIILPRENILLPVIQSLPPSIKATNVTMGFPIKDTPAYNLVEILSKLQISSRRGGGGAPIFYHQDALSVLNHPYVRLSEPEASVKLALSIKRTNRIYPQGNDLAISPLLQKIFTKVDENALMEYLLDICSTIAQSIAATSQEETLNSIDLEFLLSIYLSLTRLRAVLATYQNEIPPKVLVQLLRRVSSQERVAFAGEPIEGIQIMGFLETRNLDFENIIFLSFNDDVIPGKGGYPASFITPSLRAAFGLPDSMYHDAISAYNFYRLLHRAKRVYLVYSSRTEGLSSGERSRFALQLELETMVGRVKNIQVGYRLGVSPSAPITVEKSHEVLNALFKNIHREGGRHILSPSALSAYIFCPLKFYFKYCAGIAEEEDVAEEVGSREFGIIIHAAMEKLYAHLVGNTVIEDQVQDILNNPTLVVDTLDAVFCKLFLHQDLVIPPETLSGRNLLARNAMLYSLKRMLNVDICRAPFHLLSHEEEVCLPLSIECFGKPVQIMLGGIIDRLEMDDKALVVIDYKTGGADEKKLQLTSISELFDPVKGEGKKEIFQILCYCMALKEKWPNSPIRPGLWFIRTLAPQQSPYLEVKVGANIVVMKDYSEFHSEFKESLSGLIQNIFNTKIPFAQTNDENRCRNCPYKTICGKE